RFQWGNRFNCNCATPLVVDNLVFVSSAYGAGAAAVQIDKDGAGFKATKKWTAKQFQNQFATSVILDGYLYGCHGDLCATMLRCFDLKTGQEQWTSRDPAKCSLIAAEGHLIVMSESGTLRLVEANSKKYVVKGMIPDLLTRKTWPPPALCNRKLYVRDE